MKQFEKTNNDGDDESNKGMSGEGDREMSGDDDGRMSDDGNKGRLGIFTKFGRKFLRLCSRENN